MEYLFTSFLNPESIIALLTLTGLEIVLGIDNIIFLTIMVNRLPARQQSRARLMGLGLAMLARIALLVSLSWVMGLTHSIFTVMDHPVSGRDLILLVGGLFLIVKSINEIYQTLNPDSSLRGNTGSAQLLGSNILWLTLLQIALIDIVFSLDSVMTAVGMVKELWVMITAIVLAAGIMMIAANAIGTFVKQNPTLKILALSFLVLVGVSLVSAGLELHISNSYLYFAMGFALTVELLNIRLPQEKLE